MLLRDKAALDKWLLQNQKSKYPLAVVMGSSVNGLSFLRSFGRRGVPTLLLDSRARAATSSRYAGSWILPEVEDNNAEWLDFFRLLASVVEYKPILFCTTDSHVLFLARNREALGKKFRFLISDQTTVETIINKRTQYCAAQQAGISVPRTFYPESLADVRSCSSEVSYPCILKPYSYQGRKQIGRKAILIISPTELIQEFEKVADGGLGFMVQEIIPGHDSQLYGYCALWDSEAREFAWYTKQKLRQSSQFGSGIYQQTVDAPHVAELGRRLFSGFAYRGFGVTEFKLDSRDNTYKLIEMNARTPMNNQMAVSAGLDMPWIGYCLLTGREQPRKEQQTSADFEKHLKWVDEEAQLSSIYRHWGVARKQDLISWFISIFTAKSKATWAWDDPRPFFAATWNLVKAGLRKDWTSPYMPKKRIATAVEREKKEQRHT